MPRHTAITRSTALFALFALAGCEGEAPALADAAVPDSSPVDGGAPADARAPDAGEAICIGAQAEPLGACSPPTAPDTACTLSVGLTPVATLDAAGRLTSFSWDPQFSNRWFFDGTGALVRQEMLERDCVTGRNLRWRDGDRLVTRRESRSGPICDEWTYVGDVDVEWIYDEGCDCEDTWLRARCDVEDGRRVRCERLSQDGRADEIESWTWNADGLLARYSEDEDGDGVEDHIQVFEYDAEGRTTVEVESEAPCDGGGPCTERRTWIYEDDLRRTTSRVDVGDDGSVERMERVTVDEIGRLVLRENSRNGGATWLVFEWIREVDGNRTTITHTLDGVAQGTVVEETDDAGRLLHRTESTLEPYLSVSTLDLAYDDAGRVVEERRTIQSEEVDYACEVAYAWAGDACPVLRVPTDADVTPPEPVLTYPVGTFCIDRFSH